MLIGSLDLHISPTASRVPMAPSRLAVAVAVLSAITKVAAHGEGHGAMNVTAMEAQSFDEYAYLYDFPSYAGLQQHSGMMLAHVVFMTLAWFFILPIGVMLSIGRSRFALAIQLIFLVLNGIGVVLGTAYNVSTPDLYEKNAHHSIGWIATWIMTAQAIMSLLFVYAGRTKKETARTSERAAFLPASLHVADRFDEHSYAAYRWSGDSGHGTEEPSSPRGHSCEPSPSASPGESFYKPEQDFDDDDEDIRMPAAQQPRILHNNLVNKYLSSRVPQLCSSKITKCMEIAYEIVDRTILILGFIALTTGVVTYAGIFRGNHVFNGLAHFIKGGIFFWYGMLTLGRWMGCFADFGWAWNIRPTPSEVGQWAASVPSAEFVESFLIFFYGSTNVFLEHLAGWGKPWTAQDFEHVSISILFFGGGLWGMFVESKTIRKWLNTTTEMMPKRTEVHPQEAQEIHTPPKSYNFSNNPVPGLVILLLGIMMSSHHQDSEVSTMVHKQWGTLFVAGAFARGFTYVIMWLSPPSSIYPSRPPTEMITSFCLISGGLLFMASTKDIVYYMEVYNLMAMFLFTVVMGFSAFLMAFEVFVLALKGWAVRHENKNASDL